VEIKGKREEDKDEKKTMNLLQEPFLISSIFNGG